MYILETINALKVSKVSINEYIYFMKRVFLAISFKNNEFLSQYISTVKGKLLAENIKWVESENIHLTLKYFGPTKDSLLKKVKINLENVLKAQKSFSISFNQLGVFGSKYQPRVLWMGMDNMEEVQLLEHQICQELEKLGIESDRQNFVPHLTIGRIKHLDSKKYFQSVVNQYKPFQSEAILIDRVFLYQSILLKEGPIYKVLKEYELK